MRRVLLEVAVETVDDAIAAEQAGADRLELSQALDLGGLTPTIALFREVVAAVAVPVMVMIRPRPGNFVYSQRDFRVMLRDLAMIRKFDPAGVVFGALHDDGRLHREMTGELIRVAAGVDTVFHRAFDHVLVFDSAASWLIDSGVRRILTAGGPGNAEQSLDRLRDLQRAYGHRIEIMPAGGIRAENVLRIVHYTHCQRVHGSFRENGKFNRIAVRKCRSVLDRWTAPDSGAIAN